MSKKPQDEAAFAFCHLLGFHLLPRLKGIGRQQLYRHEVQELGKLDPPDLIESAKAAAVLKAMLGSTPVDKFSLENCYLVQMPSEGQSVSGLVKQRLNDLGIQYHDFWPYLRTHGWLKE